ncbi:GNAT family N-acetyltransferase [Planotetraspora thailandica]|uniref:GNAT family N-acetyltransferase n=1 Tax=Planotetraspora thailandica TaxID=487172 RepID=UPI001EF2145C|nr:GNAT family N-acetyltransferase [Planotetraspora thailandica]
MNDSILIRPGSAADAAGIAEVFLAARGKMTYLPELHTDEETRAWISQVMVPDHEMWVATANGEIVGFAALSMDGLEHLYISPPEQGRGVGSELLSMAKRQRPEGLRLYVFQPNAGARRFYERHGFTAVEFGDGSGNEEGVPDALYAWPERS